MSLIILEEIRLQLGIPEQTQLDFIIFGEEDA